MAKVTGGDRITKRTKDIIAKAGLTKQLRVGFLAGENYPNGTSVAMVAAIQEFGAPKVGIPPRPFFRNMIAQHKREWGKQTTAALKQYNHDGTKALRAMGDIIAGELRQSIVDTMSPPLSPVTLMLRKMRAKNPDLKVNRTVVAEARARVEAGKSTSGVSTKPLVDTGYLLSRVDYEVSK